MPEHAVLVDSVSKRFDGKLAVDSVSVTIPVGSTYAFIGPNGAGKTTTIRMIMDIIRPDSGRIEVFGSSDPAVIRKHTGYLPEERGMYKKMKVLDFIVYIATLKGMGRAEATRRGMELLEQFNLAGYAGKTTESLSKGMQQKLQFIVTIAHEPELLILDEPFSGLDPVNIEAIKDVILESRREGRTIIFSTHMMEHAERLCDHVFMIHQGKKVIDGPLEEIREAEGGECVRLRFEGDGGFIPELPYVERAREYGNETEVFLTEGADPQQLLRDCAERLRLLRFEITQPSLYDIFLKKVGVAGSHRIRDDGQLVEEDQG